MISIDPRLRWALRRQMWPVYWRDFRFIKTDSLGQKNRIDVIGPSGIGKTYLTNQLVTHLGETVPSATGERENQIGTEWAQVFEKVLTEHSKKLTSENLGWETKHRKTSHLADVIELESIALKNYPNALVTFTESLERHTF